MIVRDEPGQNGQSRVYKMHGDSIADVQHWLRNEPRTWSGNSSVSNEGRTSWDLGVGYEGALRLAEQGWSEGAKDLSNRLEAHLPNRDKADTWRFDVAGEIPDIGRFLSGDPAHMRRHGHPKGHKPILSIAVNIRLRCDIKAQAMANYGAAMTAIVDRLEHIGRRVELTACFSTVCSGARLTGSWIVKRAEDPLDLASVAFALAHPAASRRIRFAMYERAPEAIESYGYGHGLTLTERDLVDPLPGTFCVGGLNDNTTRCHTLDDALVFVRDQINEAAGEELVDVA
jgi:hypothetical protein